MKKLFAVISGASVLLSVGLSNPPAAHAGSRCAHITLAGSSFAIQATGTVLEGAAVQPAGPFAATGLYNFSSNGNFSTTQNFSANGQIAQFNALGTYKLEDDCTITFKFTDKSSGVQLSTSGVVVKDGQEILVIETDPNTVISAVLKKVSQ